MDADCIVIFQSTHQALKAEKILQKCDLKCRMIPLPKRFSASCGLALKIDCELRAEIEEALTEKAIEFEGIHNLDS